jgi:uncharacterized membrane protein
MMYKAVVVFLAIQAFSVQFIFRDVESRISIGFLIFALIVDFVFAAFGWLAWRVGRVTRNRLRNLSAALGFDAATVNRIFARIDAVFACLAAAVIALVVSTIVVYLAHQSP